jgi:hypothetical protein
MEVLAALIKTHVDGKHRFKECKIRVYCINN